MSMPRILKARGYESYTFHTNTAGSGIEASSIRRSGSPRYFDRSYFGTADKMAFGSSSDHVLFEKTLPQLEKAAEAKRPFYAQVITMSSHFPFKNVPSDRRKLRLEAPYSGTIDGRLPDGDPLRGRADRALHLAAQAGGAVGQLRGGRLRRPLRSARTPKRQRGQGPARARGHDYNKADRLMVPLIVHLPGQNAGTRVADSCRSGRSGSDTRRRTGCGSLRRGPLRSQHPSFGHQRHLGGRSGGPGRLRRRVGVLPSRE